MHLALKLFWKTLLRQPQYTQGTLNRKQMEVHQSKLLTVCFVFNGLNETSLASYTRRLKLNKT